jgi:hypothetical protein
MPTNVATPHYPSGCAKWNPVAQRLCGPISVNWAGQPLRTWDTMLAYIRGTTTTTGLDVQAVPLDGIYPTGQRVSDAEMDTLNLAPHKVCPAWNYTLRPRSGAAASPAAVCPNQEVIV